MKIKCSECGRYVVCRFDGLPDAVGFELEDGTILSVCSECIMKVGDVDAN